LSGTLVLIAAHYGRPALAANYTHWEGGHTALEHVFPCEITTQKVFAKSYLKLARFTLKSNNQTHTTALLSIPKRRGCQGTSYSLDHAQLLLLVVSCSALLNMSRRRALTNLTVAPPKHAEEVATLEDLGPTNQALRMLVLATNSQVNCFGKHVEFHLP
jgi:hypothetical protein